MALRARCFAQKLQRRLIPALRPLSTLTAFSSPSAVPPAQHPHAVTSQTSSRLARSMSTAAGPTSVSGKRRRALYAGTFDPPSSGHADIISRALELTDTLVVAVAVNPSKKPIFSADERVHLIRRMVDCEMPARAGDVEVVSFDGLIVDLAKAQKVDFLARGLRAYQDFDYEMRMSIVNRRLTGIETIFLMAAESNTHLSSSLIRELARWKKTIPGFVPESIADEVFARMGVPYEHAPPTTVK